VTPSTCPRAASIGPLLAVLGALLFSSGALAGPWSKAQLGGYLKVGSATFLSDTVYDLDGVQRPSDPFTLRAQTMYAYGEFGITDRLTIVGFLPYILSTNQHAAGLNFHTLGFGDAMLGLQVGLVQGGPLAVSVRAEAKVPLYEGGPSIEGRQTQPVERFPRSTTNFPALGDGQVDLTGWLSVGGALPVLDGFFSVEGAYRYRSSIITDAVLLNVNVGVFILGRKVLLMANSQRVFSLPEKPNSDELLGKAFWGIGPSMAVYAWRGLALEVGGDYIFQGMNTAGGFQALWGVSYAW
jgi:hypothetical protein